MFSLLLGLCLSPASATGTYSAYTQAATAEPSPEPLRPITSNQAFTYA